MVPQTVQVPANFVGRAIYASQRNLRMIVGAARMQAASSLHDIEDYGRVVGDTVLGLLFVVIMVHFGREDLIGLAFAGRLLMSMGDVALWVAGELAVRERNNQTLELHIAAPARFQLVLLSRMGVASSLTLFGLADTYLIARFVFGVPIQFYHPELLILTLLLTFLAATGTALVIAAFLYASRNVRTVQNALTYPLIVLAGVLVPVTFLPDWLEPISRVIFLYWSGELIRASLVEAPPQDVAAQLVALTALGFAGAALGVILLGKILDRLRADGSAGFA